MESPLREKFVPNRTMARLSIDPRFSMDSRTKYLPEIYESGVPASTITIQNYGVSNQRTAFIEAAKNGEEDLVQELLRSKEMPEVSIRMQDITRALQGASEGGHEGVVQMLLDAGANVNVDPIPCQTEMDIIRDYDDWTADRVEKIVCGSKVCGLRVCGTKVCGQTALQAAAGGGHLKIVETLLKAGAHINASASRYNGRTALQAAAGNGHIAVVSLLLKSGADINAEPSHYYGRTALQAAAEGGHTKVVSLLVEKGADINAEPASHHRRTALQAAAEGGHSEIVTILLDAGADINAKPSSNLNHGRTALQAAAASGHAGIVLTLLESFADINAPPSRCHGRTALQAAAEGGHTDVVFTLLNAGADPNAEPSSKYGRTALQAAAEAGHATIVRILRNVKANINAEPCPNQGRTALQAAAESGHAEIVSILLDAGADINAQPSPKYGGTALQMAAAGGYTGIVSALLDAGADINAAPSPTHGRTALQAAGEGGHAETVFILLQSGADINAEPSSKYGITALQAAAASSSFGTVSALLKAGADINAKPTNWHHGTTALQAAARGGHVQMVSTLLQAGAHVNAEPSRCHGRTALQAAAMGGHSDIVSTLLRVNANINTEPSGYSGRTALQAAAEGGHADVVWALINAGAWVNAAPSPSDGRTALQAAAEAGHADIVSILLKAGSDVNAEPSSNHGRTALQAAAEHDHAEIVSILLKAGADINAKPSSSHGRTALQAAAEGGHVDMVLTLLEAGADINAQPSEFHGRTALQTAAGGGYIGIVSILLSANTSAEINARPSKRGGRTALQAAAEGGHVALVSTLLDRGADINAPPARYSGRTALQAAAGSGHQKMAQILLDYAGPDQSPVRAPPVRERRRMSRYVPDRARPDQIAMRVAAEGGHGDVVKMLLDAGVDVDATDVDGTTCLGWANSHPQIVRLLIERKANVHIQDITGATPIHWAARGDSVKSLLLLIEAGADTEAQDYQDRRPLDILLDQLDMPSMPLVRLLLKNGSSIRGRVMGDWRKVLKATKEEIVVITQALDSEKSSIDIDQLDRYSTQFLEINPNPKTKVLYSTVRLSSSYSDFTKFFPCCEPPEPDSTGNCSVVQWSWTLEQRSRFFGMPPRPDIHGTGLPNHIGKLATTVDTQALLTCYVGFEFLVHDPDTESDKTRNSSGPTAGKPFKTRLEKTEISWSMRRPSSDTDGKPGLRNSTDSVTYTIFQSVDYRSTLDIGWIPDHGVDFFSMFIVDLQKKWTDLLKSADKHLTNNRMTILENRGRAVSLTDNLLLDEKQWMKFREFLQTHVQQARYLLQIFRDHRYLCEETLDFNGEHKGRPMSLESKAVERLSGIIDDFERKVDEAIKQLDQKKHEMIQLECNLASIYEARTSKTTGMSMKRLSWITFIFLPMMFVASLFGMNIDTINGGPHWTWVLVFGGTVFGLVVLVWALLKRIQIEQWLEDNKGTSYLGLWKLIWGNLKSIWRKEKGKAPSAADDLESGKGRWFKPKTPAKQGKRLKDS